MDVHFSGNILHDFFDEMDLYIDSGRLVNFLRSWQPKTTTLSERMLELIEGKVTAGFIMQQDHELMQSELAIGAPRPF